MYLPYSASCLNLDSIELPLAQTQYTAYWVGVTYTHFGSYKFGHTTHVLTEGQSLCYAVPLENLRRFIYHAYAHFPEWPARAFLVALSFFKTHPHVVHLVSFGIFFGPIIVLLPLLLAHELIIAILFNLSFLLHGLLPGSLGDRYDNLHSVFDGLKGSIFSSIDALGARYNKLTTKYWPLVIVRLGCFVLGVAALYYIMSEKQRQAS